MAVYQFSALADGQAISFSAAVDRLNFDQTSIAAGDLSLTIEGSSLRVTVKSGPQAGKDVLLTGTALEQIAGGINFTFADGSVVRIGDNTVGTTNDAASNFLTGGTGRDLLMGLGGNDNLQAGDGNDSAVGGSGNDTVSGNNGNDWVEGGTGIDTLNGGGGQDTYVFREFGAANADLLADFSTGWDRIELDAAAFTQIGTAGRFSAGDARFFAGTAAHDADDRIIFNSATGQIFYDADGNGAGAAQLIGTLGAGRTVVAADFNVIGTAGGGNVINGTAVDDTLIGTPNDDTINGLGGNDSLVGREGADSLNGGDGNDTLDAWDFGSGDGAADTLSGGFGNDVYQVHDDGDIVVADPGGIDTVRALNASWTLAADLENLDLEDSRGIAADGTGNALNNVIRSASEGGTLSGLGGNDLLIARHAQNTVTLLGGDGNDTLEAGSHTNLDGGAGNDVLDGSFLEDNMTGGAGADIFHFDELFGTWDLVTDFASGADKFRLDGAAFTEIGASGNFTVNDARFFAGTAAHDADDRVIFDAASGGLWYDGDGNGAGEQVLVAVVTGNIVATDITVINGTSGGETINGAAGNDSLVGGPGNDTINGFAGNDTIDGAGGADSMVGGTGHDLFFVDHEGDVVVELEDEGIDEVRSSVSYTLSDFVNNLTLIGLAESGTGNAIDNVITGNDRFNVLRGLDGNDTLIGGGIVSGETADIFIGGTGNDSLVGSDATDVFHLLEDTTSSYGQDTIVGGGQAGDEGDRIFTDATFGTAATTGIVVDLAAGTLTGGHAGSSAVLSGIEDVFGTRFADRMTGNAFANEFDGGAGNDTLNGGAGIDRLAGGAGADSYLFTNAPGEANADNVVGFETGVDKIRLDASVMTALGASGNFSADDARFFAGAAAHDADDRVIWDGTTLWYDSDGTGAAAQQKITDLQTGTLVATDIAVDNGSGGGQTINGTASNDSLVGGTGNDTINGNAGNDTLIGNAGDDSLDGGSGTDSLNGGVGNDIYVVSTGDILADAGGIDLIFSPVNWSLGGSFENLEFTGTASVGGSGNFMANRMVGNSGANFFRGREGNDTLTGGGGADSFEFVTAPSASNADLITDFASGVDKLRLDDAVHAGIGAAGNFASGDARFAAGAGFTSGQDASDRVIYDTSTGNLYYDSNGSAAGGVQLVATLQGAPSITATDIGVI